MFMSVIQSKINDSLDLLVAKELRRRLGLLGCLGIDLRDEVAVDLTKVLSLISLDLLGQACGLRLLELKSWLWRNIYGLVLGF